MPAKTRKCDCDVQNNEQLGHFGDCVLIKQPQHTPTPWTVGLYDASGDFIKIGVHVAVCKPEGDLLATTGPADDEQSKVDAAFIVRAVNSYEELVISIKQMMARLNGITESNFSTAEAQIMAIGRAAIAKAEGQNAD